MNPRQTHLLCAGMVLACLIPVQSLAASKPLQAVSARAVSSVMVDVVFSRPVDAKSARNPANYRIVPKAQGWAVPVNGAVPQVDGKTVRLYTGEHTNGAPYAVLMSGIRDKAGNLIVRSANNPKYTGIGVPPKLISVAAFNATTLDLIFDEPLAHYPSTNIPYYTIIAGDNGPAPQILDIARHDDERGVRLTTTKHRSGVKYTIKTIGIADKVCNGNASTVAYGAYIGKADPAYVTSVKPVSSTSVEVHFSEPLDTASAQNTANYHLQSVWGNTLQIMGAALDGSKTLVRLTTNEHVDKTSYSLTLRNVLDAGGTAVKSDEVQYAGISTPPQVVSARAVDPTHVVVTFSKPMSVERMTRSRDDNVFSGKTTYYVDSSEASDATVLSDPRVVLLTVKPMDSSMSHNLHINGVWDTAGNWVPQCQAAITDSVSVAAGSSDLPFRIVSAQVVNDTEVELAFDKPFGSGFDAKEKYRLACYDIQGVLRSLATPGKAEVLSSSKVRIDFGDLFKGLSDLKVDRKVVTDWEFVLVAGGTWGVGETIIGNAITGGAVSPKFKGFMISSAPSPSATTDYPVYTRTDHHTYAAPALIVGTPEWTKSFQDTWKR